MKIGPIELSCDFDASQDRRSCLWSPPISFVLSWPRFRWSFGLNVMWPEAQCNQRWFWLVLTPLVDLPDSQRWFVWRMGIWRLYWWLGFRVEREKPGYALDCDGKEIFVGDTVALYGYLSNDGYSTTPEEDTRPWGRLRCAKVIAVGEHGTIQEADGVQGWWESTGVQLVERGNG